MKFRKVIFWTHLVVALVAGLVIFLMSATGVLLTYEQQINDWANRSYWQTPPTPDSQPLPVAQLLAAVTDDKATPTSISFQNDPAAPASIAFGRGRTVYVNPYTGAVHGEGSPQARAFFRSVTDWHRWLALSGESRATGRFITGACNLGFLFLVISGFYLWWPRKWNWNAVKMITFFQPRLRGKARDWNWHHVIGLWTFVPLLLIVATGAVISYPWAGDLLYRVAGETPPPRTTGNAPPGSRGNNGSDAPKKRPDITATLASADQALMVARQSAPGWQTVSLMLPTDAKNPLTFTLDHGSGRQPHLKSQLTIDGDGKIIDKQPFASQSLGRRLRILARFTHTGEVGGFIGQTIAGLASLGAVVLVITGFTLAWRRLIRPSRAGQNRELAAASASASA
ncbi:MAG: PepSY domain-containing protein [Phycisphaerales bacterium]|nr:PepSY domain-containing protein [Phycisphaerales bacterium]